MDKISEKVIRFICYGGLEKDEFYSLRPVFDKMNLKVWRIASIFMVVVFGGLFLVSLGDDAVPQLFGVNLAMMLVSAVFVFLLFYIVYEDGPFMNFLHYALCAFMMVFGIHLSMYVFTESQSTVFFVLLIVINVITADTPIRVAALDAIIMFFFLIEASEHKPVDPVNIQSVDMSNCLIFTAMAIGLNILIMNYRCQNIFTIKHANEKIKNDSDEARTELRRSAQHIEVLSALSADFENIMYIDLNNNKIMKCFSNKLLGRYEGDLTQLSYGEYINLFIEKIVYEEDRAYVKDQFYPRGLLLSLAETPVVLVRYRAVVNDEIRYYESKIIPDTSSNNKFMVIAASHDIDAETRRYMEYSKTLKETEMLATSDMLTGVKNKTAYFRAEKEFNSAIGKGVFVNFAVIMCDVNNLKTTNDTLGHEAGDKLIKTACSKICSAFQHSPVYRIGGDEFVIIASGSDYDEREQNFEQLRTMAAEASDGITFASGMSIFNPDTDFVFNDVFARADAQMYENKKQMKAKKRGRPRKETTTENS